jgi:hypothetical protein
MKTCLFVAILVSWGSVSSAGTCCEVIDFSELPSETPELVPTCFGREFDNLGTLSLHGVRVTKVTETSYAIMRGESCLGVFTLGSVLKFGGARLDSGEDIYAIYGFTENTQSVIFIGESRLEVQINVD